MREISYRVYLMSSLLGVCFLFLLAGMLSLFSTTFTSETIRSWTKNMEANEFLRYVLRSENHYFIHQERKFDLFEISNIALKLGANIQPTDIRTFLGRELPGFSIFDTDIVVAGEGTDYTTIPIESPPPLEVLLKEREIAYEQLQSGKDETPPIEIEKKSVFIYHTHSWESFTPLLKGIKNNNEAISANEKVNIITVGKKLAAELNKRGIGTIHDTTDMHKKLQERKWTFKDSYKLSREVVKETITQNKEILYLIDIHRDSGTRDKTTKTINGKSYARIYFIIGKEHKNYEKNLKIAKDLHQRLEKKYPGMSRGIFRKGKSEGNGIYNQDISERALLIEIGGVENRLEELYNTAEAFADVFAEYFWQAEMVNR